MPTLAHVLHKGQVCAGGCLTNALPGHAFTIVAEKGKGCAAGQRMVKYSREARVK